MICLSIFAYLNLIPLWSDAPKPLRPVYNGTEIAAEEGDEIFVWEARTGKLKVQVKSHLSPTWGNRLDRISLSNLASVGELKARAPHYDEDDRALWGVASLRWPYSVNHPSLDETSFTFSPNGKYYLSKYPGSDQLWLREVGWGMLNFMFEGVDASFDRTTSHLMQVQSNRITLWSIPDLIQVQAFVINKPSAQITSAHFSPDGNAIVATCSDRTVRVWNSSTGALVKWHSWPESALVAAGFGDNQTIIAVLANGTIGRWDLTQDKLLTPIQAHDGVRKAFLSNMGRYCVITWGPAGSNDPVQGGTMWELNTGKHVSDIGPEEARGAVGFGIADLDFCTLVGKKIIFYAPMLGSHWTVDLKGN